MALEYVSHDDYSKLTNSAVAARSRGDLFFYTGKKCVNGHLSPKYASSGNCAQCIADKRGTTLNGFKGWVTRSPENQRRSIEASDSGFTKYISESPCPYGHFERFVSSNNCVQCNDDKSKLRKDERRSRYIFKTYGISQEQYLSMMQLQDCKCSICEDKLDDKNAHIDHDHKSLKVRSILCSRCNQAIGLMREDVSILKSAVRYLEKHNET